MTSANAKAISAAMEIPGRKMDFDYALEDLPRY